MPGDIKKAVKFSVNVNYPEPKIEDKNIFYANLLLEDYSGAVSELTASLLYVYQHFVSDGNYDEYAETVGGIAIIEMKHLELLGETIKLLGLKPAYAVPAGGLYYPWNTTFIDYSTNIDRMLKIDIESEIKAIEQYEEHKTIIKDRYIVELLNRIIEDEKLHLKIFKDLKLNHEKK
ncbi:Manganese containing catalase [Caloramator mitchellensis]|uniref:Manganese containing catalase n=1 Tax=Caloramator mitchellensis TaxID=908809 RepID=A0A0R3JWL9_CALMK|nr:ferritin family protein [Caloramator mitchellensis]KRQ87947.1 Manganese containing catalase [Caloramator mitchellensis]